MIKNYFVIVLTFLCFSIESSTENELFQIKRELYYLDKEENIVDNVSFILKWLNI